MTSLEIFLQWFYEYYSHEFEDFTMDFKKYWIKEIIENNWQYIDKQMVVDFDGCARCGICCKEQHCPHYDSETKLCTRHDNPIDDLCKTYPWCGDLGISPVTINCRYQVSFFIDFFNKFFQQKLEEKEDA